MYTHFIFCVFKACLKTCFQRNVINKCGCADPYIAKNGAAFDYADTQSCDVRNGTQGNVYQEIRRV